MSRLWVLGRFGMNGINLKKKEIVYFEDLGDADVLYLLKCWMLSVIGYQLSVQLLVIVTGYQLLVISYRLSVIGYRLSVISCRRDPLVLGARMRDRSVETVGR